LFCGDIDMCIVRDGVWFYQGSPIERKKLVKLFASILCRDEHGDFWLETPYEKCRIKVDDAPLQAIAMSVEGSKQDQCLSFKTNVDDIVVAGRLNPIRFVIDPKTEEPSPYLLVREGIEALITRPIFYDLVELAVGKGDHELGVLSNGVCFTLVNVD
jgi:hypothetical protein